MPGSRSSTSKRKRGGPRNRSGSRARRSLTSYFSSGKSRRKTARRTRVTVPRGKLGLPASIRARVKTVSTEIVQISHNNTAAIGLKPKVWSINANNAHDLGFNNMKAIDDSGVGNSVYHPSTSQGHLRYKNLYNKFKVVNTYAKVTFMHTGNFGATVIKTTSGASQYRNAMVVDPVTGVSTSGDDIGAFQSNGAGHIGNSVPPLIVGLYASKDHGERFVSNTATASQRAASGALSNALQNSKTVLESDKMKHSILMPGGIRTCSMSRSTKSFFPLSYNTEDTQGVNTPQAGPTDEWYIHVFVAPMNCSQRFEQLNIQATVEIVQDIVYWDSYPPDSLLNLSDRNVGSAGTSATGTDDMEGADGV